MAAHKIIHTDTESVMTAHPVPNAGAGGKRPRSKAGERVASAEKGRRSTTPTGGKSSRQGMLYARGALRTFIYCLFFSHECNHCTFEES